MNARMALGVGLVLQACAGWQMALLDINMTDFDVFWTNFVQGFGFGLAYTPMTALAFRNGQPTDVPAQPFELLALIRPRCYAGALAAAVRPVLGGLHHEYFLQPA